MEINFVDGYAEGWAWAVPKTFKDPLETGKIKDGYVFYNSRKAYGFKTWSEWLKSENPVSIQVKSVIDGIIIVEVYVPNEKKTAVIMKKTTTFTHQGLIELLRTGKELL